MFQGFSSQATSTPFGQTTFGAKPAGTGTFAAPAAFGSSGGSLFGSQGTVTQQPTSLFGSNTAAPAFGQAQTTQPSFGGFSGTGSSLFGSQPATNVGSGGVAGGGGGLFGGAGGATSAFGQAKPATAGGFGGFSASGGVQTSGLSTQSTGGGLFSQPTAQPQGQTPLFGAAPTAGTSGLFGSTAGSFGSAASAAGGGTTIKFTPVTGSDTMVKSGQTQTINTRHHCITCMKEYEAKSLEELRLEDYVANRKGPQQGVQSGGLFGAAPQSSLFGSSTIGSTPTTGGLFGNTSTTGFGTSGSVFGTSGGSLFGKTATAQPTAFGSTPATNTTNTFGFNAGATANNPFATNTAQKPFGAAAPQTGGGLFGTTTSQPSNVFGAPSTGGFGAFGTTQNQTSLGLFNQNKPFQMGAGTGGTQGATNFSFGQSTTAATPGAGGSSLFGAKPATGAFGSTGTSAFGQASTAPGQAANRFGALDFGQSNQTQTLGGGAFGTFNKPATSGFTFGQNTNTNTTLGGGLNLGGSNLFGNTAAKPGGLFGSTSGGGLFGSNTFGTSGTNTFGTTPNTGLGSSLSLGGSSLMMISGTTMQNNQNVNNPLNQQIMALASVPFGDMSLFKNVLQITGKTDELLKPTSPAAQKAINSSQNFTVSPRSGSKIKVKPIGASNLMKKSLFGGLDDEDTNNNNNDSWLVKPSPKRLILRTKPSEGSDTTSTSLMTSSSRGRLLNMSTTSSTGSGGTPGTGAGNQDEEEVTFLTLGTPKFIQQSSRQSPASNKDAETQSSQSAGSADKLSKDQSLSSPASKSNTSLENNGNTSGQQKSQSPSANKSLAEDTSWTEKSVSNYTQTQNQSSENKENADHSSSSTSDSELEESLVVVADDVGQPHPTGIRLRRVGYYTIPPLSDLAQLMDADGRCVVDNFTIGRLNYGNVFYPDSFDVSGLNIDEIVHIRHKEIVVYPDDASKPPLGTGLNRRAQVTLDRVWPSDKNTRLPISDPQRLAQLDYEAKLRKASAKNKTRFVEYRPQTGSWVFKVDHFSKYGLSDSEEDDAGGAQVPSDVKKLKLTAAAVAQFPAKERPRRGLDMPGQTIMNGHGSKKTVFLDEGDQDMCDLADGPLKSVFDGTDELDLNHKSPAARFANDLGTSSHKVQVMKQSFYHEDDEDDYNEYNDDYMDMADFRADSILDVDVDAYERDILKKSKMADMRNGISLLRSHFASPLYDSVAGASPSDVNTSMPGLGFQAPIKVRDLLPSAAVGKPGLVTSPAAQLCGPPPPAVVPQSLVLKQMNRVVPWSQSLAAKAHQSRCLSDFSIFMGRRFKVGWSPSCTLISVSTQKQSMAAGALQSGTLSDLGHVLSPRAEDDFSPFVLQRLRLKGGVCDDIAVDFQESIEEHMEVALMHSIVGDEDGCPVFAPCSGNDELHAHCASAQATNDPSQMETTAIWELCAALWGDLDGLSERQVYETDETEAEGGYWAAQERKRALSEWLENCALAAIKEELGKCSDNTQRTVFTQLTAHQVMEACRTAQDGREHFMSLLLAQVGCGAAVQTLAEKQLAQWVETRADEMIDTDRLKLVQLVAGMPLLMATQGVVNVCEGLDWRRALAVHLWYLCSQSASITDALLKYETAFHGEDGYAAQPVPAYSSEWESSSTDGEPIFDVCYHLLRLYSFRSHPLERLLNPATHTSDPLDYRLSWLLMRTLEALGYSHLSQLSAAQIHTAFALQLESHGCWHWAVFVLMHLADARRRRSAVEEMIGRHVTLERPDQLTHEERFVLEKLRVPKQWLFKAKATMAKSYSRHEDEAIFLLEAEDWSQSHEVIMEHIAAKAIINEKYEYMWRLLVALVGEQQERAAAISGWEQRGALIWHYLRVVDEVNAALDQRNPYSLEKLQPQLTGLCTRIVLLPTPTAFHRLCQAEIVKRIANLIYSLFVLQRKEGDLDSVSRLAHLISNLPLPEDYAHQEMRQMVTSWQDTTL